MYTSQEGWDLYHLNGCLSYVRLKSKDPSRKNGCILTGSFNQIIMSGFNGFAIGLEDDPELVPERYEGEAKYLNTLHAEEGAIILAARTGVKIEGASLYCSLYPCLPCAIRIVHAGIKTVITLDGPEEKRYNFAESRQRFNEGGVAVRTYTKDQIDKYREFRDGNT
jgi:dCMP deaminase